MSRNITRELAEFLWHDIQGKEEDPFGDLLFVKRYMSNASKFLKAGGDFETAKLAMLMMKRESIDIYSPQQTMTYTAKGGMSFYERAEQEIARRRIPPPEWDVVAYKEYLIRQAAMLTV